METDDIEVIAVFPNSKVNVVSTKPSPGKAKPSIHINPKMQSKIHVNPKLINIKIPEEKQIPQIPEKKNSIFVNPKLIETWSSKMKEIENLPPVSTQIIPNSNLVAVSKRKLIRMKKNPKAVNNSIAPVTKIGESSVLKGKLKLDNRIKNSCSPKSPIVKGKLKIDHRVKNVNFVAKVVKSPVIKGKLKLDNRMKNLNVTRNEVRKEKLKIDNRARNANFVTKIGKSQIDRGKLKLDNRAKNLSAISQVKENVAVKEHLKLDNSVRKRATVNKIRRKSNIISIGGVMYKSTGNRLVKSNYTPLKRKRSLSGQFIVTKDGKKMRRLDSTKKRLSLENVTKDIPKRRSAGQFIVTKNGRKMCRLEDSTKRKFLEKIVKNLPKFNQTRKSNPKKYISDKVKQKSLQILRNKLRKNNQPCLMFQKFGYCANNVKGTCSKVHDQNQISLCKKFLQGNCFGECKLSHNVGPEKMPTCKYFLMGCCSREACSYLHVKVSDSTPICLEFLRGYCKKGSECKQRHVYACPEFEKTQKCSKGKYCTYPHLSKNSKSPQRIPSSPCTSQRYYQGKVQEKNSQNMDSVNQITCPENDERARPSIGQLPAFIPIN